MIPSMIRRCRRSAGDCVGVVVRSASALGAALVLSSCATFAPALDLADPFSATNGATAKAAFFPESGLNYLLTLPKGYGEDPNRRWPVLIFLHGLEERGERIQAVVDHPEGEGEGLAKVALTREGFDFVTLSPVCPKGTHWFSVHDRLARLIEHVLATHAVDPRRVILTGVSMGGMGTWSLGMARPGMFAALLPIAGGIYSPPMSADVTPVVRVPVWAFHDRADPSIPLAQDAAPIERLKALGGDARLTITQTGRHYIHQEVFADPAVMRWLAERTQPPSP